MLKKSQNGKLTELKILVIKLIVIQLNSVPKY